MSSYEERFEAGIEHLRRYVAAHGCSSPPHGAMIDGFLIGSWVGSRRTEYRRGRLSAERIRRIETEFPDWRWNVREAMFDVGLAHLRRYVASHGTSRVGFDDVVDGFPLGQWARDRRADYRTGRLSAERIELFEREFPDWQWAPQTAVFAAAFETGIEHLHRYVAVHGTPNARRRDVINEFTIGTWVQSRRADYRKGRLSAERIERIETEFPDLQWTIRTSSTPRTGR